MQNVETVQKPLDMTLTPDIVESAMLSNAAPASSSSPAEGSLEGARVLICEDEALTQMQLQRILKTNQMNIVGIGRNGEIGVALALLESPDLILMDINMPALDGLEASRMILENQQACIVIVSAYLDEERLQKARDIGISGWILKPVTSYTLLPRLTEAWNRYIHRKNGAQGNEPLLTLSDII